MKKPLLILVFALVCSAITFGQNTIYVNSLTGNDATGDGTIGTPYKTFHKGYSSSSSGDTIDLTGTFDWMDTNETGDVADHGYILDKNLIIQGQGANNTFIQAASSENSADRRVFTATNTAIFNTLTINGITIRNGISTTDGKTSAGLLILTTTSHNDFVLTVDECSFDNNNITSFTSDNGFSGAALSFSGYSAGTLVVNNTTFKNNNAHIRSYGSGALYVNQSTNATLTSCTFEGNTGQSNFSGNYYGTSGAFYAYRNAIVKITNCSFSNNNSDGNGGAIILYQNTAYLTNNTIAGNTVTSASGKGGGILINNQTNIYIKNNLIANNTVNGSSDDFYLDSGSTTSNGYNIVESSTGYSFSSTGDITGDQSNLWGTGISLTPTLADNNTINGTQTLALLAGSIAINAGDNTANATVSVPLTDQRGFDREGTTDIGAYEFDGTLNTAPEINSLASVNFAENATGTIIDVQSTDADGDTEGSGLTYTFSTETGGGVDNDLFAIDANTGVITFLASPDYELPSDDDTNNNYEVQVTVTDSGSLSAVQDITITVTDQTSEPVIESIVDFEATSGKHNLTSGTRLYYIGFKTPTCTSYDLTQLGANIEATSVAGNVKLGLYSSNLSTLLYETSPISVTGGVDEYVSASIPSGTLTLTKNTVYYIGIIGDNEIWIDAEPNPTNNGTATNLSGSTLAMYKVVPDVPSNSVAYPTFPLPATLEIAWYRAVSLVVKGAQVPSTIDTSVTLNGDTITANNESASYQWINCSDMSSIDGETSSSFTATASGDYAVIVTEGGCSSTSSCTTVEVNNTPVITSSSTASFAENATGTVLDVQTSDADGDTEGSGLTYAFSTNASGGVDNALFAIDTNTGVITFLVAPDFENAVDDNTNNDYEVQVTVTDSGSLSAVQDITITVTDVTETVTFTIDVISDAGVVENSVYTSVTPNISGTTPIGTVVYTLGGNDASDFTINGTTGIVSMVARDYENAEDGNTDNVYEVSITATDSDGNFDIESWTVTVNDDNGAEVLAQIGLEGDNPDIVNSIVTVSQLNTITGLTSVVLANETAYQDYIDANPDDFSSPATLAEVQAMITAVNITLGVNKIDMAQISMYPNPVENTLHITAEVEIQQVSLFNLIGQKVLEFDVKSKITTLDVSLLPQGVYNVILKSESAIKTVKIVKH